MNRFNLYYDTEVGVQLLGIECSNYTTEDRLYINDLISDATTNKVGLDFLNSQTGVIGYAEVPTQEEFRHGLDGVNVVIERRTLV